MPTLVRKKDNLWYLQYSETKAGQRAYKTVPLGRHETKREALLAKQDHLARESPEGQQILFETFQPQFEVYLKANKGNLTYMVQMKDLKVLAREFGTLRLDQITAEKIYAFRSKHKWADTTVRNRLTLLKELMRIAKNEGYQVASPWESVKIPSPQHYQFKPKAQEAEIVQKVLEKLDEPFKTIAHVLWSTGLRPGELYLIQPEHIDYTTGIISVQCTTHKKTKTKRFRPVPIHPTIRPILENGFFPFKGSQQALYKRLKTAVKNAALPPGTVTPYVFRHSFCSDVANDPQGGLWPAQELMGHTNPSMTKRYSKMYIPTLERAIGSIKR